MVPDIGIEKDVELFEASFHGGLLALIYWQGRTEALAEQVVKTPVPAVVEYTETIAGIVQWQDLFPLPLLDKQAARLQAAVESTVSY